MRYDPNHRHEFIQLDAVTLECVDKDCGIQWQPRIRLTPNSAKVLWESLELSLSRAWEGRKQAKAAGESTTRYNHQMAQLKRLRQQVQETQERFGWEVSQLGSSSEQ